MAGVTISDVAERAGVSTATVSKALRGLPVSPANRARVLAVADELGWTPNPHAAGLASGRSGTLGLVVAYFGLWYDGEVIAGVEAAAAAKDFDLLVWATQSLDPVRGAGGLRRITSRCDGLLLADFEGRVDDPALGAAHTPVVSIGGVVSDHPSITIDHRYAAVVATSHLLDLGHRRIGLITGDATPAGMVPATEDRRDGYIQAVTAAGLDTDPSLMISGGFTVEGGREALRALLELEDPPSAVFCLSDEMALGAFVEAQAAGLESPRDLSIIGFGGHPIAVAFGLTTLHQPLAEMTERGVAHLLDALEGQPHAGTELLPVTLEERRSTAPPAT